MRDAVAGFAARAGASTQLLGAIRLAISEALANAIVHAYVGAARPGPVHCEAWVDRGTLYLVVTDEGHGMKPRADSPGLGLGLPLLTQLADDLRVTDDPARAGTRVSMAFSLNGTRSAFAR